MQPLEFFASAAVRRKPLLQTSLADSAGEQQPSLTRTLNLADVILYGIGCSVGAGIYSLIGIGADIAGPAVSLSFLLCGIACVFTSLSYAEFAARIPVAGSAYTFTYIGFGELAAWLIGWNLTLGYGVSSAVVARSWAEYLVSFLQTLGLVGKAGRQSTTWLTAAPVPFLGEDYTCSPLAVVIIAICTAILITGAKESSRFNAIMVAVNLSVLGFVVLAGTGSGSVDGDNLAPFFPHGPSGVARASGLVFFSYLGFDMVACLAEEVKDPQRTMPLGIVGSLLVSMAIYVTVSLVVVGMAPISLLGDDVPVANALLANGCCTHEQQLHYDAAEQCLNISNCSNIIHPVLFYGSRLLSLGAMFGLTTATFTCLMGQPRIFYRMAKDGLLFPVFGEVDDRTKVPTAGIVITGIFVAVAACLIKLEDLANMISLGTLQVFTFVNAGVILLRCSGPASCEDSDDTSSSHRKKATSTKYRLKRFNSFFMGMRLKSDVSRNPIVLILVCTILTFLASLSVASGWHIMIHFLLGMMVLFPVTLLHMLPMDHPPATFKCPYVPTIPLLGIMTNTYMMGSMPLLSWLSMLIWLICGLAVYVFYGIWHSRLGNHGVREELCCTSTEATAASPLFPTEEDSYESLTQI